MHYQPESKIDPGQHVFRRLRYVMLPKGIGCPGNQEQCAVMQWNLNLWQVFICFVPEPERSGLPEGK